MPPNTCDLPCNVSLLSREGKIHRRKSSVSPVERTMIYLDNASTSCPKPPEVVSEISEALSDVCANPSRGAYEVSMQASRMLRQTRRHVADLFNIRDESRVVFTLNATYAINFALKGSLTGEGLVSVARPLAALERHGIEVTRVPCSADGTTDPADILAAVRPDTALVALTHASNVDVEAMGITLLAISGHEGLLGLQGVGALYVAPEQWLDTIIEGDTDSQSESTEQPATCPDRFEAGTINGPGIAGLGREWRSFSGKASEREQ
jgi:cysteine desulfurase / selenocysteine lyase